MCPAMSFLAAIIYYPYYAGFNVFTFLANWLELVCYNFPFAFFTQLFFIQPLICTLIKIIFAKDIKRKEQWLIHLKIQFVERVEEKKQQKEEQR